MDHTFINDLQITLISPNGTHVVIINHIDGSGNHLAQVVLDDSAAVSIQTVTSSQAPFNGTWQPNSPLSALNAGDPNGLWQLEVQDFFSQDTGNIRLWSLDLTAVVLGGPVLQNSAPVGVPTDGDFVVSGPVTTGTPTESIRSAL